MPTAAKDSLEFSLAPSNLTAIVAPNGSDLTLTWTPANWPGIQGYLIEAGSSPGASDLAAFLVGASTTYSASHIAPGTYYVRVATSFGNFYSLRSNEVTVVMKSASCQQPPDFFTLAPAQVSGHRVTLMWTPPPGTVTGYVLEAASGSTPLPPAQIPGAIASYVADGVGDGSFTVRLRAKNDCGTGPQSNVISVTVGGFSKPEIRGIKLQQDDVNTLLHISDELATAHALKSLLTWSPFTLVLDHPLEAFFNVLQGNWDELAAAIISVDRTALAIIRDECYTQAIGKKDPSLYKFWTSMGDFYSYQYNSR